MKIDPIHQFNIEPLFTLGHIGNHTIAFTNSSLYMFIAVLLIALLMLASGRELVPGRLQSVAELSYEFIASTMSEAQAALERNLARAFDHFDEDNSGFITIEEARRVLDEFGSKVRAHSSEEARAFLKEADADGDGRIDWEEFVRVMTRTKD